jgi:hypothetical protein
VSQGNSALGHHFHKISKAELEPKIPAHAEDNDLPVELTALENIIHAQHPSSLPQTVSSRGICPAFAVCTRARAAPVRHLLWSGYVRETRDALKEIGYFIQDVVSGHTPAINARMKRFLQLIDEFRTYLELNQASMIDYCQSYWKGLPVSSSRAESTVNVLVNARMNKLRQMR